MRVRALSPFGLLVHDRRCLLLTTVLSWPVKAPARQRYATMGALGELPAPAAACRLLLAACCLLGGLLGFFPCPKPSSIARSGIFLSARTASHAHFALLIEFSEPCLS